MTNNYHVTTFDSVADGHFIAIGRRRIDQTLARADGFGYAVFTFRGIVHLKDAKP